MHIAMTMKAVAGSVAVIVRLAYHVALLREIRRRDRLLELRIRITSYVQSADKKQGGITL